MIHRTMLSSMHLQTNGFLAAITLLLFSQLTTAGALERLLAPKAELWERWQAHVPSDTRDIDHGRWDAFLARHVTTGEDGVNRFDYAGVDEKDRAVLRQYIDALAAINISSYSRAAQFAYWVNLYNAVTVDVVLEYWPVDSIRDIDISPGLFSDGPWRKKLVDVEGESLSLDDIEHRVLRPIWQDPRIHYAVNCASIGCPNLQPKAVTVENSEELLDRAAREYVNHPRGVSVTAGGYVLSSIYNWFADDFDADGGVVEHLRRYAGPDLAGQLQSNQKASDYVYDWSVNAPMTP